MEEAKTKTEPSLKKWLLWPSVIGLAYGLLTIAGTHLGPSISPAVKFYVWFSTIGPLMLVIMAAHPVLNLEGNQAIAFVWASPVIWAAVGFFVGYAIFRIRDAVSRRKNPEILDAKEGNRINFSFYKAFFVVVVLIVAYLLLSYGYAKIVQTRDKAVVKNPVRIESQENLIMPDQTQTANDAELANTVEKQPEEPKNDIAKKETYESGNEKILSSLKWKKYSDVSLGISFEYPSSWESAPLEYFQKGEFYLKITKPVSGGGVFMPDNLDVRLLGTKQDFIPDHPDNIVGNCAYEYKNIDEFCQKGCVRVNGKVAIDLRNVNHGEPVVSLIGYSTASRNYPRLCFEMTVDELLRKISDENDLPLDKLRQMINTEDRSGDRNLPPEIFEALTVFRHVADSLNSEK